MTLQKRSGPIVQCLPNKLYFVSYEHPPTANRDEDANVLHICLDNYVHYDAFYDDFGPYNLAVLYRFCDALNVLLEEVIHKLQLLIN